MAIGQFSQNILYRSTFPFEQEGHTFLDAIKWTEFLPFLVSVNDNASSLSTSKFVDNAMVSYFQEEAYTAPFKAAAKNFLAGIDQSHGQNFSPSHLGAVYENIVKSFVSKSVSVARYCLHINYSNSTLRYGQWCGLFETQDASNPWFQITEEFPVLTRFLANVYSNFFTSLIEMLSRLEADRADLAACFMVSPQAPITALNTGLSDPHNGGRTVMRLEFHGGASVIYKPKPLDIEKSFSELARQTMGDLGVLGLTVMPCKGYGWAEDVGDRVESPGAVLDPYSIGRASACFWLLNATDLHFENVRTTKNGVYALDLETLLAAPVAALQYGLGPRWRQHSINATMLFEGKVGEQNDLAKIGGFDPMPVWISPIPLIRFRIQNDCVKIELHSDNAPADTSTQKVTISSDEIENISAGFRSVTLGPQRDLLRQFIIDLDDACNLRLVLRDTIFYVRILERVRQPRFLRDGNLMYQDLTSMHRAVPDDLSNAAALHEAIKDEIRQLLAGDIPYFTYCANDLSLNTSAGRIDSFFELSGKNHALDKLQEFEPSDIDEQIALISIALGRSSKRPSRPLTHLPPPSVSLNDAPATEISKFSSNVVESAFRAKGTPARWLSLQSDVSASNLKVQIGEDGFFGGYWGIMLALQSCEKFIPPSIRNDKLGQFLENEAEIWAILADQRYERRSGRKHLPLGFSGLGGELFAYAVLLSQDNDRWFFLQDELKKTLTLASRAISNDTWLDVVGGSAGLILGCEQILQLHPGLYRQEALGAQRCAAMHLMAKAIDMDGAPAWQMQGEETGLLGYAHGWAGIVAALSTVERHVEDSGDRTEIQNFLQATAKYPEIMLEKHGTWQDHRGSRVDATPLNYSWCNGAPGFLRGMLEIENSWSPRVKIEVERLLQNIVRNIGLHHAYRFCCGEMGSVDFVLDIIGRRPSDKSIQVNFVSLRDKTMEILNSINGKDDIHNGQNAPELMFNGLFQGKSGIAYTGLRLFLPDLPSLSGQHLGRSSC